jgi:hypothetical protein
MSLLHRAGLIIILTAVLVGLFALAGTTEPDPDNNNFPGPAEVYENPDEYIGERVTVTGTVVETDPLTIETQPVPGERTRFVIENADTTVDTGDTIAVYGNFSTQNRIDAINTVRHKQSNRYSMYLVSFFAGLLVLGRLLNQWTVDTRKWAVVQRTEPRVTFRRN